MQIRKLADELRVAVGDIKKWLKENGFQRPDRDFAGAEVDLERDEERSVRKAHERGVLASPRRAIPVLEHTPDGPGPEISSDDLDGLPAALLADGANAPRGGGRHAVFVHQDLLEWLQSPHAPTEQRRVCTRRIQEMVANGRATRVKGVRGSNAGWLRIPVGGNGGNQFYLWLTNQGEPVRQQREATRTLHDSGPAGARFLRCVRHHDATSAHLDVGSPEDYVPLDPAVVLAAEEDGLADPLVEPQRALVEDSARVRIIAGRPGSGKTTSLLAAASRLTGRALYVTWSTSLAQHAKAWLEAFAPSTLDVEVKTFREFVAHVDPHRPLDTPLPLPDAVGQMRDHLGRIAGRLGPWCHGGKVRAEELYAELHARLVGAALPVGFQGCLAATGPMLREADYRALRVSIGKEAVDGALLAARTLGPDLLRQLFAGPAVAFERARALQRNERTLDPGLAFDWILVDEVQDLTLVEQWLLIDVAARAGRARGVKPGFVVAGDEAQTVRPTAFEFGPLTRMLEARLDARSDRRTHELVQNLRAPETIATSIERAAARLYGLIPRRQRPRGRRIESPGDVTVGRVLQVDTGGPDALRRVLEAFAQTPGDAALVHPGAVVPRQLEIAAKEAGVVVWTSETVKGLEFRVVGVLQVPEEVRRIENLGSCTNGSALSVELARNAIDRLLVALSRTTETLVLLGSGWDDISPTMAAIAGPPVLCDGDDDGEARVGHLGMVDVGHLASILDLDAADATSQIESLLHQSARLEDVADYDGALRLAQNARGLLGTSGRPGAAQRELRQATYRRLARAAAAAALALRRLDGLRDAAAAFRHAGATSTAALVVSLRAALDGRLEETATWKRLQDVANGLDALQRDEPSLCTLVVDGLKRRVDVVVSAEAVPPQPSGRTALVAALATLGERAPAERDFFRTAHQRATASALRAICGRTDPAHRDEYEALRGSLEDATAVAALDAAHAEACGDLRRAAERWEAAGRDEEAVRCLRAIPDFDEAERLALAQGLETALLLSWQRRLRALLAERPKGDLTDAEVDALGDAFVRATGRPAMRPAARKVRAGRRA